jgi:hypothetical protein
MQQKRKLAKRNIRMNRIEKLPNEQDDGEGLCGGPSIKREREKGIRHESKKRRAKLKQNRIRSLKCRTPKKAQKNEEAKI